MTNIRGRQRTSRSRRLHRCCTAFMFIAFLESEIMRKWVMDFRSLHYIRGIPAKPMRAWDYDLTCKVHIHTYIVRACQDKKKRCCFFVSYSQGKYAKKAVPFFTQKRQYLWRRRRPKRRHLERRSPFRVYTHWYQPWVVTHEKDIVKNCPGRAIKFIGYEMAGVVRIHAFIKVRRTHAFKKNWSFLKSP